MKTVEEFVQRIAMQYALPQIHFEYEAPTAIPIGPFNFFDRKSTFEQD